MHVKRFAMDVSTALAHAGQILRSQGAKQWEAVTLFPCLDPIAFCDFQARKQVQKLGCVFRGRARVQPHGYAEASAKVRYTDANGSLVFRKNLEKRLGRTVLLGYLAISSHDRCVEQMAGILAAVAGEKPCLVILDVVLPSSHTKRCEEAVLTNMKTSYSSVDFLPYSFETFGLPASGQRSLLVACGQDMVPAELRKVFLASQQAIAKAATLKMANCLAKHSSDTFKYEMEMMRRGSKRTIEDANLAQQDADLSEDMPCKKKKKTLKECLEEAFHHRWLPTQEYEIPDPYAEQLKKLPKQNHVIHVHACVLAHRAANIKSNVLLVTDAGSASWKAARLQEDTLPEMKQSSEILCLSRAGDLRLLMPTEILACKGFSGISLSLLSGNSLKGVLASCTPAPIGCAMLLLAAACLK